MTHLLFVFCTHIGRNAALVELDRKKLTERVVAAEATIYTRFQQISQNSPHDAERQAIADALAALRVLKRDELGFPDWERNNYAASLDRRLRTLAVRTDKCSAFETTSSIPAERASSFTNEST
jgi:hypothetical protein